MDDYSLTVGLEIHAELKTKTKMFCNSKNDTDEVRPNVNICPVCLGYPGTLPTINKEAVKSVLKLGVAVKGELADYTEFDRKNYFYPDIPKGYQISQYKYPLVKGGVLAGVAITRIHLEEDTAKSTHDSRLVTNDYSLLDFNRAGVPLVELVTEPVIYDPLTASRFAKEFQLLLTYLGIANANMEKGEMRVEANISVNSQGRRESGEVLGTKVEVKNLNSFKSVERAIKFEFERQKEILSRGEKVIQETRGWDEERGTTFPQRVKEESHDYRYFPDPDLPKLFINEIEEFGEEVLRATLPELPQEKRERLMELGIPKEHVEIYVAQPEWGRYFEKVKNIIQEPTLLILASNYITSELKIEIPVEQFSAVIKMIASDELSSRGAKEVLKILTENGGDAREIVLKNNLMQISDEEILRKVVREVIEENKNAPVQFLVGQAMKRTENRANPVMLQKLFLEMLDH